MRKSQAMKPRKYPSAMKRDEERQRKFLETRKTVSWAEVARQKKESASAEVVKGSSALKKDTAAPERHVEKRADPVTISVGVRVSNSPKIQETDIEELVKPFG